MRRFPMPAVGVWVRLSFSAATGLLLTWLWHLGYQEPPWHLSDPAFWLHLATEGVLALGVGGSIFVLSGAVERYIRAERALRQGEVARKGSGQ